MSTTRPIGIDLFAGAGGLSLGFEQAGFDVAAAVEVDPIHCATHLYNLPDCKVLCRSVALVTGAEIREAAGIGDRDIDAVFGGPPCQGFSMIGKRALDDPRNSLVHQFVRLVTELRPKYFVFENVPGLTVGQHRSFLAELVASFAEAGYAVVNPYRVLSAVDYGVPQSRRRLFLLGARIGLPQPEYPEGRPPRVSVREALDDLPKVSAFPSLLETDSVEAAHGAETEYSSRLRGSVLDPDDYSYRRKWDRGMLTSSRRTVHTDRSRARFERTEPGRVEPVSRFLRLDPNGLCNTLRAGTNSERGAFTSARPIHPFDARCITVREAARLHSYPDWFRFHGTKWHGFRQVGNSVPPLLARAVAASIVSALGARPERPDTVIDLGDARLLQLSPTEAAMEFGLGSVDVPKRLRREPVSAYNET